MASFKSKVIPSPSSLTIFSFVQLYTLFILITSVKATYFNYPSFGPNLEKIFLQENASSTSEGIDLTTYRRDTALNFSVGRALYKEKVRLWDSTTDQEADFTTHFSFLIHKPDDSMGADGLAFFLAQNASSFPPPSGDGGFLGIFPNRSRYKSVEENSVVAIEFDTYANTWDPDYDHIGIDINSIESNATLEFDNVGLKRKGPANVSVIYNSSSKNLSVFYAYAGNESVLSYALDLKNILPEWVYIGFSATTGTAFETHRIQSWEFNSTEFPDTVFKGPSPSPSPLLDIPPDGYPSKPVTGERGRNKINLNLVIGLVVSVSFFIVGVGLFFFMLWRKSDKEKDGNDIISDMSTDDDYDTGTGPKRFSYDELVRATNDFADSGKLGEGGFGGVYRGILSDSNVEVAVKKVSKGSRQGKKEFVSEVKIISQLRHRNLVQLLGWCHERGALLLVYEYMLNGSLDFHLFGRRTPLTWALRYKIAHGLASALLYLHEDWIQCVVHRDIKSSNIMLDSSFNAKLGDFGLARLVDHEVGVKTTMLAGTMGYMAPESHATGKAGKESDVYSFGVVSLEIACGRRVVERREEVNKVGLISWVWGLYGNGRLVEAADPNLDMDFDEQQLERLLIVGLWCANLDYNLRPSIKQAIAVLDFEAPLPDLPFKMSVPTHFMPSLQDLGISYPSSSSATYSQENQSKASYSSHVTNSSKSTSTKLSSSLSLLHEEPR